MKRLVHDENFLSKAALADMKGREPLSSHRTFVTGTTFTFHNVKSPVPAIFVLATPLVLAYTLSQF